VLQPLWAILLHEAWVDIPHQYPQSQGPIPAPAVPLKLTAAPSLLSWLAKLKPAATLSDAVAPAAAGPPLPGGRGFTSCRFGMQNPRQEASSASAADSTGS